MGESMNFQDNGGRRTYEERAIKDRREPPDRRSGKDRRSYSGFRALAGYDRRKA